MIETCPICDSNKSDSDPICKCGYNFEKTEISDEDKLRIYYGSNLQTDKKKWVERADFILHLHDFQQEKKGKTSPGTKGGWGDRDTQKLLGEKSVGTVNKNLNMAREFEEYPTLKDCKNMSTAQKFLEKSTSFFKKYDNEDDLQQYLENNWDKTPFGDEWELKESQVNVGYKKRMDLLAYHRTEKCWLVVELKRDKGYKETVGQILRYMGWFKKHRAGNDEQVKGLIITSWPANEDLCYALLYAPNVDQQVYFLFNEKPEFDSVEGMKKFEADLLEHFK
jgi:hypothetical protein